MTLFSDPDWGIFLGSVNGGWTGFRRRYEPDLCDADHQSRQQVFSVWTNRARADLIFDHQIECACPDPIVPDKE